MTLLRNIDVEIKFFTSEDGGRSSTVNLSEGKYRPHLRVNGGEYLGVTFVDGPLEPVAPGWSGSAIVALLYEPNIDYSALKPGASFEVLEGARIVAVGNVQNQEQNEDL